MRKKISWGAQKCTDCYNAVRKGVRPNFIQLIKDFKELKSFVQVGKKYGVSDNAVRKWVKLYGAEEEEIKKGIIIL